MPRPTLGNSKTERLQLVITADEIEAVDYWRYANRVPSRSEAVRKLIQIGLYHQSQLDVKNDKKKAQRDQWLRERDDASE